VYVSAADTLKMDLARVVSRLSSIVPEIDPQARSRSTSPVGIMAGAAIETIVSSFSAADDALYAAGATITNAGMMAPLDRRLMMSNAANDVTNVIAGLLATATATADALAAKLTKTALPPRPPTKDPVLQEALIAATKTDVTMVLDRVSSSNLAASTAELLADYSAQGDDLAVWLLTASPWLGLYFKARNVDLDDLTVLIPKALNGVDDPEQTIARQILAAFDGRQGVRALIAIAVALANVQATDLRRQYGIAAA
jgi:hypothetical protein